MKTNFRAREPFAGILEKCARDHVCVSPAKPERFIRIMKENQGVAGAFGGGFDKDGLEKKNPVVVGLGDSVTAGHFESLLPVTEKGIQEFVALMARVQKGEAVPPVSEITDARESYLEKFRGRLIEKYELTSVSTINAGIAGDTIIGMSKRAERDVIRYQPDLVLINGSLNWSADLGDAGDFEKILTSLVRRIKEETSADIILLTPNGDRENDMPIMTMMNVPAVIPDTEERAEAIRRVAKKEEVCLADVRAVWSEAKEAGCPWRELLANSVNHPGVEGHEVYAEVLMKLFED